MSTTAAEQATKPIVVYCRAYTLAEARERVAELTAQNKAWGASDDRCTQLNFFAEQGITPNTPKPAKHRHNHDRRDLYQAPDRNGKTHYAGITNEFACGTDARATRTEAAIRVGTGHATCQRCLAVADREDREALQ